MLSFCSAVADSSDREFRRYVFSRGDQIRYHDNQMGRIDQIFIHSMNEQQRLFILVTPINILDEKDEVLGLHRVQYMIQEPLIVGINAIAATKLYIVRIDDDTVVWVDWQVEWL